MKWEHSECTWKLRLVGEFDRPGAKIHVIVIEYPATYCYGFEHRGKEYRIAFNGYTSPRMFKTLKEAKLAALKYAGQVMLTALDNLYSEILEVIKS